MQLDSGDDVEVAMRIAARELAGQGAQLYLIGSRARGTASRTSDIDIAILPIAPLPAGMLARIREALEECTIPYEVDVVDLSTVGAVLRHKLLEKAVPWNA